MPETPYTSSYTMRCAKHPNVDTVVRCGKCETPVCPKCSVYGPAGIRCRDCAFPRDSPLYHTTPGRLAAAIAAGLAAATVGGYLLALASEVGFFVLWGGLLLGAAVGEAILRVTGYKRGPQMMAVAGACTAVGALLGLALWWTIQAQEPIAGVVAYLAGSLFYAAGIVLAVFAAVSRIRYI